jgi:hypothetical protein
MVKDEEGYPDFPKFQCSACGDKFDLPRYWTTSARGDQIIIDWNAGQQLMKLHHLEHTSDLLDGIEKMLRDHV